MFKIPGSIFLKCFPPGDEGAQKLILGTPNSKRNGSRMVDMRNGDWEMDRAGPTDLFRPFRTPQTPSKNLKNSTPTKSSQTKIKNRRKIPLSIPLGGGRLYW